jgi:hypothetical protein
MREIKSIKTGISLPVGEQPYLPRFIEYSDQEKEASILWVAVGSRMNRSHERRRCAIPPERCCTAGIREKGFGRGPVVRRRGELAEKWGMFHETGSMNTVGREHGKVTGKAGSPLMV